MTINTQHLEIILNDHITGNLTFAAYRQKRALFINGYIKHCGQDNTLRKDDTLRKNTVIKPAQHSSAKQGPTASLTTPESNSPLLKFFAIIALISIAGGAWYFSSLPVETETLTKTSIQRISSENMVSQTEKNTNQANELFIFKFIEKDRWDTSSLSDFLVQWQSLSRKQQSAIRGGVNFTQLSTTLRKRVNEQRALNEVDKNAKRQESLLIWFSVQLSISIN